MGTAETQIFFGVPECCKTAKLPRHKGEGGKTLQNTALKAGKKPDAEDGNEVDPRKTLS
jgi:hypothetical protein